MPTFDIVKKSQPSKTFRVASVMGKFDLQSEQIQERFVGNIDIDLEWQIGLIVGNSGTGKTTIAKQLFPDSYITHFHYNAECVMDDMPEDKSVDEITKTFNAVGFSSPPSWLKPYAVLSNGEKMRCDLAKAILSDTDLFVFDEFTSVVDRTVAQIGSFAMQKAIRKTSKKFIAVTCHYDVQDWLLPDWVFDTNSMTFQSLGGQKKNRPDIKFEIYQATDKSIWKMFAKHHYLSHSHNNAASVYVAVVNDKIAGFYSVLPFPHPKKKNTFKGHRLVVLPDFQGIGIGLRLRTEIAKHYVINLKKSFIATTSHPAIIFGLKNKPNWVMTRIGRTSSGSGKIQNKNKKGSTSTARITTSWEYIVQTDAMIK
jgi:energy-coupling factor transporter ATP-binding protein EcfA2/GNAT superfamily N-acetyltransferase